MGNIFITGVDMRYQRRRRCQIGRSIGRQVRKHQSDILSVRRHRLSTVSR